MRGFRDKMRGFEDKMRGFRDANIALALMTVGLSGYTLYTYIQIYSRTAHLNDTPFPTSARRSTAKDNVY